MDRYRFYAGRYTKTPEESGIALLELDPKLGTLKILAEYWSGQSPSFLIRRGNFLYAANELEGQGYVSACRIDRETGGLTYLGGAGVPGQHTCHITATENFVYAANYSSGNIFGARIQADGSLGEICASVRHEGSGVNPRRQEKPHAHSVNLEPLGERIIAADLGTDKLMIYRIDRETGSLMAESAQPYIAVNPGEGPRHMVFHPDGGRFYVVTELGLNVLYYRYQKTGQITEAGSYPLLSGAFTQNDTAADLQLSPDGKRLYASVRGKNLITAFHITTGGELERIGSYPSHGDSPRNLCITADGKFILIAHDRSGEITGCPVNQETGAVEGELGRIALPGASCVIEA